MIAAVVPAMPASAIAVTPAAPLEQRVGSRLRRVNMETAANIQPAGRGDGGDFDFRRFDVYRVALEFQALVPQLLPRRGVAGLRDQLDRASSSVLLNIAEGAGRFTRAEKAVFLRIANVSATECAAVLDVLFTRGLIPEASHRHAHGLLVRVSQMLTRLVLRMQA